MLRPNSWMFIFVNFVKGTQEHLLQIAAAHCHHLLLASDTHLFRFAPRAACSAQYGVLQPSWQCLPPDKSGRYPLSSPRPTPNVTGFNATVSAHCVWWRYNLKFHQRLKIYECPVVTSWPTHNRAYLASFSMPPHKWASYSRATPGTSGYSTPAHLGESARTFHPMEFDLLKNARLWENGYTRNEVAMVMRKKGLRTEKYIGVSPSLVVGNGDIPI